MLSTVVMGPQGWIHEFGIHALPVPAKTTWTRNGQAYALTRTMTCKAGGLAK